MSVYILSAGTRLAVRRSLLPPSRSHPHNQFRRRHGVKQRRHKSSPTADSTTPSHPSKSSKTNPPPSSSSSPDGPPTITDNIISIFNPVTVLWQHNLNPVTKFFRWYARTQQKRPYATQLCSSLLIYLCGDLSAQPIGGETYDPKRTARHLVVGGVASIPGYHWFLLLGNHFNYPSRILSIATKVLVQQLTFTPIFNTYFFGMQSLLSGASLSSTWTRIQRTVPESFINSCKLWPAVTAVNFSVVPPQFRAVFAGCVAVGWQSYLSWLNQRAAGEMMLKEKEAVASDVPAGEEQKVILRRRQAST